MFNEEENKAEENNTVDYHTPQEPEDSNNPFEPKPKKNKTTTIVVSALLAVAAICIVIVLLTRSGDGDSKETINPENPTPSATATPASPSDVVSGDSAEEPDATSSPTPMEKVESGPVTLGEYKGLKGTVSKAEVTDAEIEASIKDFVFGLAEKTPAKGKTVVEDGQEVDIDYEGFVDDKPFDGGSAQNYLLTIGSGNFIEGFETGLIGKKVGDKVTLNLTFPENYAPDLAGKNVVFQVTINEITQIVKIPELSDALVKDNTDSSTIKEYKESLHKSLLESREAEAESQMKNDILKQAVDNAIYPDDIGKEIDAYNAQQKANNDAMAQQFGAADGASLFTSTYGMTIEEYDAYMLETATNQIKIKKVLEAVAEAENLTLTDEEYESGIKDLIENFGYESKEQLFEMNKEEDIQKALLSQKAQDFIIESAVIKK